MVHTTNRKDQLAKSHPTTIKIKGHDGTRTKTELVGSIYIKHKGQTIELQEVHYHPKFSNLVSGLVWSLSYSLQDNGDSRLCWWKNNIVFEFEPRTFSKKLLIKPDKEEIYTTETDLQDLHERKPSFRPWHKWRKACTPYRAHLLRTRRHQSSQPEGISRNYLGSTVYSSDYFCLSYI
jgi:hypothetical protein